MNFKLSKSVNSSNVFLTRKAEMAGRWDPSYFRPELVALEKRVRSVTPSRLRDYVRRMAGGATPSTKEAETHYTESEDGVPFIRVQNLSTTGRLNLEDCKRITRSTHEGLLGRSKLSGGELLVKITGVGRMAVASVVPDNFEANINQHIVAIRTGDKKVSESLAAWLNLDSAERLASRRSTGGTRPALDYPALLSIPVVTDERIPVLMQAAVKRNHEQISRAQALLATAEELLLNELGMPKEPDAPNELESRIFRCDFSKITGERFDPHFHRPKFETLVDKLCRVPHSTMRELVRFSSEQWDQKALFQDTFPYIEIGSVDLTLGSLAEPQLVPIAEAPNRAKMLVRPGDLLVSLTRPTRKAICFAPENLNLAVASNGFCVIRGLRDPDLNSRFLFHVLRSQLCTEQFDQRSSGGNYPAITEEQLSKVIVPLTTPERQAHIAKLLDAQYAEAEALFIKARTDLEVAKRDIEALILGEGATS
jgi:hypothetical protein